MVSQKSGKNPLFSSKKSLIFCVLAPVLCCAIYVALCTLSLTSSIWFDESYSAYLVRGDFGTIWNLTSMDVHPPFFYFLLKIWTGIFGATDVSMRFMSVFFGGLTIIALFHLLKRWFGEKAAAISTLFLSLSPMFIRYGQEMRMYTLVFLIVVLATYALDRALETKKTRYYIFYAILISLGMWTHYFTAIAWLAHIIYYKWTKRGKIFEKKMFWSYVLAVALFAPWIPSLIRQVLEVQSGFWIPSISIMTPVDFISQSFIFAEARKGFVTGWFALLVILATIFLITSVKRVYYKLGKTERQKLFLLIALIIFPPLILMILSLPPLTSMFVDRYILYSASLIWALAGLAVFLGIKYRDEENCVYEKTVRENGKIVKKTKIVSHPLITAVCLLIACGISAVVGIINVQNREPEGYAKDIVFAVRAMADPKEQIVVNNEWSYYDAIFYDTEEHPIYGVSPWINYQYGSIFPIENIHYHLYDSVEELTSTQEKFWYITDLNDTAKTLSDYKLPDGLENYRIVSDISAERHVAFELEKAD